MKADALKGRTKEVSCNWMLVYNKDVLTLSKAGGCVVVLHAVALVYKYILTLCSVL